MTLASAGIETQLGGGARVAMALSCAAARARDLEPHALAARTLP